MFLASYLGNEAADVAQRVAWRRIVWGTLHRYSMPVACCLLLLCVPFSAQSQSSRDIDEPVFEIDIPAGNAADALNRLAEQTGAILLFPYDLAEARQANAVVGQYTLMQALGVLLKDSGLSGGLSDRRVIQISVDDTSTTTNDRSKSGEGSMMATKKAGIIAIIAGALTGGVNAQETDARTETGIVTGQVTDVRTGANLKGALITVESTGQTTRTDDLGRFRIVGIPAGEQSIAVSFLGYAPDAIPVIVESGDASALQFALTGGSDVEEIIVYGQRSARALALNQERTAPNVTTVLSSDLLGEFGGQTIAETLRRAPGVSFNRDPFTGDGTNVVIRGLEPDLNVIRLNGVELPEGSGLGRSANLGNILTESISEVRISKTLLASQDSAGTGGLVDISTKSPLDRNRRFASFSIEGAQRDGDFNEEFSASGVLSGRWGANENFGLSASIQYRGREVRRLGYSTELLFGEYLPLQIDGMPTIQRPAEVDPRLIFPFEDGASRVYPVSSVLNSDITDGSTLGITLSSAWDIGEHTQIRLDYQRSDRDEEQFARTVSFDDINAYELRPVESLSGEERRALGWGGNASYIQRYAYNPEVHETTDVFTFNGRTSVGKIDFNYNSSYALGETRSQDFVLLGTFNRSDLSAPGFLEPDIVDPAENLIISLFNERVGTSVPLPRLSEAGFAFLNDPASTQFSQAQEVTNNGRNERLSGDFSLKYSVQRSFLDSIEIGVAIEQSEFRDRPDPTGFIYRVASGAPTLADVGIQYDDSPLEAIGIVGVSDVIGVDTLKGFLLNDLPSIADDPNSGIERNEFEAAPLTLDVKTEELEFSAYLQGELRFGDLTLIPGVRLSHFDVKTKDRQRFTVLNPDFTSNIELQNRLFRLVEDSATQTKLLPRIVANYRPSETTVLRFGYFKSIARPQIELLTDESRYTIVLAPFFGPNRNQPVLNVNLGNPDLQPAETDNFDLSLEWYEGDVGIIKLGAFYKRINNLLESNVSDGETDVIDNVVFPDDPELQAILANNDFFTRVFQPQNNEDVGEIWGIESAFERQFPNLPGTLSGLGIFANYTFTESSKQQPVSWDNAPITDGDGNIVDFGSTQVIIPDVSFNEQPKHSGSFGVTYNKYGIDANIAYTGQSRRRATFGGNGLSVFEEAFETLDARVEYRFTPSGYGTYRVFLEGTDLLSSTNDPALETTQGEDDGVTLKYFTGGQYFGGRQLRIGVIGQF